METPERILETALRLFASRGFEAVGVQEITESAETTKPPLYHHFGSKKGLLEALIKRYNEPYLQTLAAATAYRGDLPFTLFKVVKVIFAFASAHQDYYRLQLSMWYSARESVPHQAIYPWLLRQHQLLEALFQDAVRDHGNLRGHHSSYAISLMGIVNGYVTSLQSVGLPLEDEVARQAVKQFMYGIYSL